MKLIVGLGNPDPEYQQTRHNIGFSFLDYVAKKIDANDFADDKKLNALVSKSKIDKFPVVLAKPLSYVNKSGEVVSKLAKFYKVKAKDIIVVQDDLDIEFGSFKNSFDKNSGGHKGINSIIKNLKTKEFYRLRIGVAVKALQKARQESDAKRDAFVQDFVLAKFSPKDQETIKKMFPELHDRLLQLLKQ
jgi:PTH1 family peptidyl-tRNA hydrolase